MNSQANEQLEQLKAENKQLREKLDIQTPRYEELVQFAFEYMYNFNSGLWPDDWNLDIVKKLD